MNVFLALLQNVSVFFCDFSKSLILTLAIKYVILNSYQDARKSWYRQLNVSGLNDQMLFWGVTCWTRGVRLYSLFLRV